MQLKRFHYVVYGILFITVIIDSMEATYVAVLLPAFRTYFHVAPVEAASILSIPFLGGILGAIVWGNVADLFGRKRTLVATYFGYGAANLSAAFSTSLTMLVALRALAFFVFAGAVVISFPYFQEFMPTRIRGRMLTLLLVGTPSGTFLSSSFALGLLPSYGWQGVFIAASALSLWGLVILAVMPESPFWLVSKGRIEDAKRILFRIASKSELLMMGIDLNQVKLVIEKSSKVPFKVLWSKKYRLTTTIVTLVALTYAFGYWGIFSWIPGFLIDRGVPYHSSLVYTMMYAVAAVPGYICTAYLMEKPRIGRKKISFVFLLVTAIASYAFLTVDTVVQAIVVLVVLSFFSNGIWGTLDAWFPEQFPTEARGSGNGWAISMERFAPATAPLFVAALLPLHQGTTLIGIIVGLSVLLASVGSLFLNETRGANLS